MRTLHWPLAVVVSVSLHMTVAWALLYDAEPPAVVGASGVGSVGIEVGLGMAGTYAEALAQATAPAPAPEPTPPAPKPQPKPEPAPARPQPTPQPEPQPAPPKPVAPTPAPTTAIPVAADGVLAASSSAEPQPAARATTAPAPASTPPAPTVTAATGSRATGSGSNSRSGGKKTTANNYFADLSRWLNRNKTYPVAAKQDKEQGTVLLQFTFDRAGNVLARSIKQSSGSARLDQAALDMIDQASPLPGLPDSIPNKKVTIVIPIEYSLITNTKY
jgi:protein TonB